jgi:hypothetical protein
VSEESDFNFPPPKKLKRFKFDNNIKLRCFRNPILIFPPKVKRVKLNYNIKLGVCLSFTKIDFNWGGAGPPSGGREGEKGKGGRGEGTCPGRSLPLPSFPPWVPE